MKFKRFGFIITASIYLIVGCNSSVTPAKVDYSNIEACDSLLLGLTIDSAMDLLKVRSTRRYVFDEPPLVLRGVSIGDCDSCQVRLYVERTFLLGKTKGVYISGSDKFEQIKNKRIIGVGWNNTITGKRRSIGEVIAYYEE